MTGSCRLVITFLTWIPNSLVLDSYMFIKIFSLLALVTAFFALVIYFLVDFSYMTRKTTSRFSFVITLFAIVNVTLMNFLVSLKIFLPVSNKLALVTLQLYFQMYGINMFLQINFLCVNLFTYITLKLFILMN